ncbi:MAG TPA: hypothetical protein VGF27_20615 [Pseudoduganella sp.]
MTQSIHIELSPQGLSAEARVARQQEELAALAPVFEAADQVRLYAGSARHFAFAKDAKSLAFMSDATREVARARGDTQVPPPYDNLMCFYAASNKVPFDWRKPEHESLHPADPLEGLHATARNELQQFLSANPGGCVLSFHMTHERSTIAVYSAG